MTKEVSKWSDQAMYTAPKSDNQGGPKAVLLGAPNDPLGQIAAVNKMYVGQPYRDTAEVTDEMRREVLEDLAKTVLKMPLEVVDFHFFLEDVHRGITHQMVRQRTAAFAQESMRFAVKEDMATAVAAPPSLAGTKSMQELIADHVMKQAELGLDLSGMIQEDVEWEVRNKHVAKGNAQAWRIRWDETVEAMAEAYNWLVNNGMPAEDARGLAPTNVLAKLHYKTNLRSFYDTMAARVSDQAQFEWRQLVTAMVFAMREYGAEHTYDVWVDGTDIDWGNDVIVREDGMRSLVRRSSEWQYVELSRMIRPVDFLQGKRAFGASADRASRIGERVDAFAACGIPSSEWLQGSDEHNIPAISPDEWLLDPGSARLAADEEFDIFGQRVRKGTGWHWMRHDGHGVLVNTSEKHGTQYGSLRGGPSANIEDVLG